VNVTFDTEQKIRDNVTFMNDLARQMGYCFRFFLRSNTVYTVSGQSDPWFEDKEARNGTNKDDLEDLAVASPTTWNWHSDSINIYINNTSSGWCSFPSQDESLIFIGSGSYQTLIIHEIGHFFSLPHTHGADGSWVDNDGFSETLPDDSSKSAAQINVQYAAQSQATRDNLIFNLMSYHQPNDRFVWQQRQAWIETFNDERDPQASGEGFFVRSDGNDANNGKTYSGRVQTLQKAVDLSTSSNDVILIRGTLNVPNGTVFSKPHTWTKWRADGVIE
jgi:hypothetical protein